MPTIAKSHAVRIHSNSNSEDLMSHANAENRAIPFLQRLADIHYCLGALGWIAWSIGEK
jgi:hypothetical protein